MAFKAWMAAHDTNTKQVATRAGVSYTTLASFVQGGTRSLKGENEEKITSAYGVPAAEMFGGDPSTIRRVPLISWVTAGKLADPSVDLCAAETVEISGLEPGDYFATRVRGDSMDRIAADGATIIVNRAERDLVRGGRYVFSRRGETTFKRYATDPMRLEPESFNPSNETIYPRNDEEWDVIGRARMVIAKI